MATFEARASGASNDDELTVVVPVHRPDHGRLQRLLLPSLVENLVGSYSTIVVSTDGAGDELSELLVDAPVTVVSSGDVLPALDRLRHRSTRARLRAAAAVFGGLRRLRVDVRYTPSYALRGWFQQLALANMIETPFYLALDADMICVRKTHVNELLVDDRAPISFYERIPPSQEPWYRWAGDLLGSDPPTVAMAMPPFTFATDAVRS